MHIPSRARRSPVASRSALPVALMLVGALTTAVSAISVSTASRSEAACTKAPTYTRTSTKFGTSLTTSGGLSLAQSLAKQEANFGRMSAVRIFDPGVPPSNAWSRRSSVLANRTIVTSFRMSPQDVNAGKYDATMKNFFSTAPTDRPILWNYIHEPEPMIRDGKFTFAQYRTAFQRLATLASAYCRSNLFPTMILTGWTTTPASGRNWRDYYPGDAYTSVVAFDPYNNAFGQATSYKSPAEIFGTSVAAGKASGKPWGIAETGSNRISGDSAGTGRAAWLKSMGSYLKTNGASFVTYYQSTSNGDFELRDSPSIGSYRTLVAGG